MGRAINLDMYEGNAARRIQEGYRKPVYERCGRVEDRTSAERGKRADRTKTVYDDRGKSRTSDGRTAYAGGSRVTGRGVAYAGGNRGYVADRDTAPARKSRRQVAHRESVYGSGNGRQRVREESVHSGQSRHTAGSRRKSRRQNKKRLRRRILSGLCFYFLLAGIIATCWLIITLFWGKNEKVHAEEGKNADSRAVLDGALEQDGISEGTGMESEGVSLLEITPEIRRECQDLYAGQESLLLLVNKEHELPASYQPLLRSICKGRLEAADILYEDLSAMLEAGDRAGYQYWIASAHRDRAYQQGLVDEDVEEYMSKGYSYEAALQKTYEYTMPPGQSEHETGLALDILCSTNTIMDESQKSEPGNKWLVQHCYEYGFILRYPENKERVTGIGYEPWHFRYVGKDAAAYLTQKGWTLEEFYQALESAT